MTSWHIMPYFLNPPSQLTESRINPDKIEPTQLNLEKDGENAKSLLRGTPMCFSFPWETCRISHSDVVLEAQNLCFSYRFSDFPVTSPVRFVFFCASWARLCRARGCWAPHGWLGGLCHGTAQAGGSWEHLALLLSLGILGVWTQNKV